MVQNLGSLYTVNWVKGERVCFLRHGIYACKHEERFRFFAYTENIYGKHIHNARRKGLATSLPIFVICLHLRATLVILPALFQNASWMQSDVFDFFYCLFYFIFLIFIGPRLFRKKSFGRKVSSFPVQRRERRVYYDLGYLSVYLRIYYEFFLSSKFIQLFLLIYNGY